MNPGDKKKSDGGEDIRGLLKNNHKKIYFVCRLFANSYRQHQNLFVSILSAASQNIQHSKREKEKYVLFLRACINMAALHSIANGLCPEEEKEIGKYKSPDYQKSMTTLRDAMQGISDYEKMHLFLDAENVIPAQIAAVEGSATPENKKRGEKHKNPFAPFIKEKLIWS
jgi:hypothetical protein